MTCCLVCLQLCKLIRERLDAALDKEREEREGRERHGKRSQSLYLAIVPSNWLCLDSASRCWAVMRCITCAVNSSASVGMCPEHLCARVVVLFLLQRAS